MKKIKSLPKAKLVIAILAALLATAGATCAIAKNNAKQKENAEMIWQDDFHRQFFGGDIFAEMAAMEKQMNKVFEEHRKLMAKMFDKTKSDSKSSSASSLALYQDEKFYRYELTFSNFKKEDVIVSVDGGIMTVSAKNEKSEKNKKKGESHFSNNFYYSLSIPADAVGNPEIVREEGKVMIKFEKVESKKSSATQKNSDATTTKNKN